MYKKLFLLASLCSLLLARDIPRDSLIQGRLNIINGASAECVMHKFYTNSGWIQIEGEIGRNGIDGLYYKKKNSIIKEVLVSESKWNKSRLGKSGKNKLIKQMSKEWVLRTLSRLQKYRPMPEYRTIEKLVQNDQYRARLFRMFPRSKNKVQIQIYKIKNKGSNNYSLKILSKLDPITMGAPKNSFQKEILDAYNQCRREALHKYFPMIESRDSINRLMRDNYLQKNDIRQELERGR